MPSANTFLTTQEITFETLMILKNQLKAAGKFYRGYDKEFGIPGKKIGATLSIRKPPRFKGRTGQAVDLEGLTDTYTPLVLDTQFGVDFEVSSAEMKLSIDDMKNRYLAAAAATIANKIDRDCLFKAYQATANYVGVPGTTPSAFKTYLQAGQALDEEACPDDDKRTLVLNPAMRVEIVDALKTLFHDGSQLGAQYKTGKMGVAAGFEFFMDQNVPVHVVGTFAAAYNALSVYGAGQTGNQIVVTGFTAGDKLNVGDVITFADTYAVNPQNRTTTGSLRKFVVTVPFTAAGGGANETLNIFPAIIPSGQFQNVTNSPDNGIGVSIWGKTAGYDPSAKSTPQGMAFHENAFTLASVELDRPGGVDMSFSATDKETGVGLRFIRQYVATTDQWVSRFDVLYGIAALYPELACRIAA